MSWDSLSAFLAMGGYGFYVWGSFGATFGLMAFELLLVRQRRKNALRLARQTVALLEQERKENAS